LNKTVSTLSQFQTTFMYVFLIGKLCRAHDLVTRAYDLVTRAYDLVTRAYDLVTLCARHSISSARLK